jgi:hypothetical protein
MIQSSLPVEKAEWSYELRTGSSPTLGDETGDRLEVAGP